MYHGNRPRCALHLIIRYRRKTEAAMAATKRNLKRLFSLPALAGMAFILTGASVIGSAQTPPSGSQAAPPETKSFPADQLNDLVVPIAPYPDPLPSEVLVASTYPLEVVEA